MAEEEVTTTTTTDCSPELTCNPLRDNYKGVDEFIPLTKQAGFIYPETGNPNTNKNEKDTFFSGDGDVVYSPLDPPIGCNGTW